MKKLTGLTLVWICLLLFAGCAQHGKTEATLPDKWGITLETRDVTSSGLTLVCRQSGEEDVYELNTGSFYGIQKLQEGQWADVEYLPQEYEIAWTSEAWIIQKEGTTEWNINWSWLYGQLPAGEYRMVKPITNFRGPGDYETEPFYGYFVIE